MLVVGVREAKARFSELMHRALAGKEVMITRRGEPVARLERLSDDDGARMASA